MSVSDPTDPRAIELRRMKRVALASLLAAAAGLSLSLALGAQGGWSWLKAFCEAAVVGGLADWFAVTALFRRPLGLPIPHTALIPANKPRIADNLAVFVRDSFLSTEMLLQKLAVFNPGERLGQWLREPGNVAAALGSVRPVALQALKFLDEPAVRQGLSAFLLERARRWDAAPTAANVLAVLTHEGRHQVLLDSALESLRRYLDQPDVRELLAQRIAGFARKQWPTAVSLLDKVSSRVDQWGGGLAEKVVLELIQETERALSQPDHEVRRSLDAQVQALVERLRSDPTFSERIGAFKDGLVHSPSVRSYLDSLLTDLRLHLETDLQREDSVLLAQLGGVLDALGQRLAQDEHLIAAINAHVMASATQLAERLRDSVAGHIASTVKAWDERSLVQQIELGVGRDLQFVRLNGTLVGGVIGLALHTATWLAAR
ncbi:DUF445 domain-containing protein [Hydrogenophaga electricum]|uniref:Membrane protein n=1 Tax=Hydrogenophaga electricum TaxID=1230953 RepID=A0ABQ6BYN6_9BURK|nr:DUF445 domain-containing protein [Hydrogenophaga electricum]GLS13293.1 membrane protein [Hydrogenophaga electricum]